jgi:hypothetical protein
MRPSSVREFIHDDVLPRGTFVKVASWAQGLQFSPAVNQGVWSGNTPHNPYFSNAVLWPFRREVRKKIQSLPNVSGMLPTGTPLDTALRAIRRHVLASRFGKQIAANSAGITATVLRYQPNSGLTWHLDAAYYTVAFAYYIHSGWDRNGGGILMLQDSRRPGQLFYAIPPMPNRMVIIPGWLEHSVSLVTNHPASRPRLTISGFFVRASSVDQLIELRQG